MVNYSMAEKLQNCTKQINKTFLTKSVKLVLNWYIWYIGIYWYIVKLVYFFLNAYIFIIETLYTSDCLERKTKRVSLILDHQNYKVIIYFY